MPSDYKYSALPIYLNHLPAYTSKEARKNLPRLIDGVVDSGRPIVITKLGHPRAALVPARDLWIHTMFEVLGLKGTPAPRTPDEGLRLLAQSIEAHLKKQPEPVS